MPQEKNSPFLIENIILRKSIVTYQQYRAVADLMTSSWRGRSTIFIGITCLCGIFA